MSAVSADTAPQKRRDGDYITPQGHAALTDELDGLWRVRRPSVVKALAAAAAEGDRSENAEYIYRKKELREIDRRVRHLRKRLDAVQIVDRAPDDLSRVFFGAWVTVVDEDGDEATYRLVGPDEVDTQRRWISVRAPVAQALRGKSVGDAVTVRLPAGVMELEVIDVAYAPPA